MRVYNFAIVLLSFWMFYEVRARQYFSVFATDLQ